MGVAKVGDDFKFYKRGFTAQEYTPWAFLKHPKDEKNLQSLPPCTFGIPLLDYFNDEDVRNVLHVSPLANAWDMCSDDIFYTSDYVNGSIQKYRDLRSKYRILKFSGDTDGAVPTWGTLQWIAYENWPVTDPWR